MLNSLFRRGSYDRVAAALYITIVEQARHPVFYTKMSVPDTLDGRFELLVLHTFVVMRRLKDEPPPAGEVAQALFDHMVADMDQTLREMGVGDLSVPKKVKAMGHAFYGRVAAYERGLDAGSDPAVLEDSLRRNLYGTLSQPPAGVVSDVANYLRFQINFVSQLPVTEIISGTIRFSSAAFVLEGPRT